MQDDVNETSQSGGLTVRTNNIWYRITERDTLTLVHLYKDAFVMTRLHLMQNGCARGQVRQEAEEVAHTAFERLLVYVPRNLAKLPDSPEALLTGFIRNIWYERLRERTKGRRLSPSQVDLADRADDAELITHEKITADRLQEVVFTALENDLKPECRQLIDAVYLDGLTCRYISEQAGRGLEAVKKQLNRCRKYLLAAARWRLEQLEPV